VTQHWVLSKQFATTPVPGSSLEQRMRETNPQVVEPEKENEGLRQGRLFNPDNPPLAYSKEEGNRALRPIKAEARRHQEQRMQRHNVKKHRESSRS
jgi:hypothetical protein